jgi:anti-anti-sigma factor
MKRDELAHLISDVSRLGARVRVSLDLRDINAMTAGTLGKLIILNRTVRAIGGRLVLRNVNPLVSEVFRATRLDTVFDGLAKRNGATPRSLPKAFATKLINAEKQAAKRWKGTLNQAME